MIIVTLLVAIVLISSSSMSITIGSIPKPKKLYFQDLEEEISNGLAPKIKDSTLRANNLQMNAYQPFAHSTYGIIESLHKDML